MRRYIVIFEKSKDGYCAYVPDIPGCIAAGDSREETEKLIYEAIDAHLEYLIESGDEIPLPSTDAVSMTFAVDDAMTA